MVAPLEVEGVPAFRGASGVKYELETKFREDFTNTKKAPRPRAQGYF